MPVSNFKVKKVRDVKHRRFIASLPCLITGAPGVQCAHIRKGNGAGTGLKSGDDCCVPLSCAQHTLQGERGETGYWKPYGGTERATRLAKELYKHTGDRETCLQLMEDFKNG